MSAQELTERAPVWEALADFWLDTSLEDLEFAHIAGVLAASPYSIEEIRKIHDYEVAPAVWVNLISVAGEWTGFDKGWLIERCTRYASRRHSGLYRARIFLQLPIFLYFTSGYWRQIVPRIMAARSAASGGIERGK